MIFKITIGPMRTKGWKIHSIFWSHTMVKIVEPSVGSWYRDLEAEQNFEVVALETDDKLVEIQFFEGELQELELDIWYEMTLALICPPEDWSGPYEIEPDEICDDDFVYHPQNWSGALNEIEPKDD